MSGLETILENREALRPFFVGWPSFHDAEVVEINLWRGHLYPGEWDDRNSVPVVTIKFRLLEATQPGATGSGNDILVTIRFHNADSISIPSFTDLVLITDFLVTPQSRGTYTSGEPLPPYYSIALICGNRTSASFRCLRIEIVDAAKYVAP
jgi:hypothetical protein